MVATGTERKLYNNFFVKEEDLKYVPPYFRDVPETMKEVQCETKGAWPYWLEGSFIRIGFGRAVIPLSKDGSKPNAVLQHFFDGLGMLHKFSFSHGQVRYRSRHTHDGVVRRTQKDGYLQTIMFGLNANTPLYETQDPCSALLGARQSMYLPQGHLEPDEYNMNVVCRRAFHLPKSENPKDRGVPAEVPEEEEIIVNTDFNMLQICDAKTLEPKRLFNHAAIDKDLKGLGICAHPPKDRERKWIFNYLIDEGVLYIFALDYGANPAKKVWKTALPCKPCYIHSMAISGNYVIFIRNPVVIDASDLTKPFAEAFVVEEGQDTLFYLMEKETGKLIATYAAPHFMFFHSVNAYDFIDEVTGQTHVHVDLCSYQDSYCPYREYNLSNIVAPGGTYQDGTLTRYELADIGDASTSPEKTRRATALTGIRGMKAELPRINKAYSCVPGYRYVYSIREMGGVAPNTKVPIGRLGNGIKYVSGGFFGGVAKGDWETGTFISWEPTNGESCPCEPVFIARPGATSEDDGIVLTIIINREGTHSILVALDGRTLKEVARADMPQVYAIGPHGTFIESKSMY